MDIRPEQLRYNSEFKSLSPQEQTEVIEYFAEKQPESIKGIYLDSANKVMEGISRESGLGRVYVENKVMDSLRSVLPEGYNDLDKDSKIAAIDKAMPILEQRAAEIDPVNKNDTAFYAKRQLTQEMRSILGEDVGEIADKRNRFIGGLIQSVAAPFSEEGTTEFLARNLPTKPEYDETNASVLAQAAGDFVGQIGMIMGAAAAISATGGTAGVALAGSTALGLAQNSSRKFQENYNLAKADMGLSDDEALQAGIAGMPGAVIDSFGDALLLRGIKLGTVGKAFKSMTATEKAAEIVAKGGAILKDPKALRTFGANFIKGGLAEGVSESLGDAATAWGGYATSGHEGFKPSAESLWQSFWVGGVLGGTFNSVANTAKDMKNVRSLKELGKLDQEQFVALGEDAQKKIAEMMDKENYTGALELVKQYKSLIGQPETAITPDTATATPDKPKDQAQGAVEQKVTEGTEAGQKSDEELSASFISQEDAVAGLAKNLKLAPENPTIAGLKQTILGAVPEALNAVRAALEISPETQGLPLGGQAVSLGELLTAIETFQQEKSNATKKGKKQQSNQQQPPNAPQGGQASQTGDSNSAQQGQAPQGEGQTLTREQQIEAARNMTPEQTAEALASLRAKLDAEQSLTPEQRAAKVKEGVATEGEASPSFVITPSEAVAAQEEINKILAQIEKDKQDLAAAKKKAEEKAKAKPAKKSAKKSAKKAEVTPQEDQAPQDQSSEDVEASRSWVTRRIDNMLMLAQYKSAIIPSFKQLFPTVQGLANTLKSRVSDGDMAEIARVDKELNRFEADGKIVSKKDAAEMISFLEARLNTPQAEAAQTGISNIQGAAQGDMLFQGDTGSDIVLKNPKYKSISELTKKQLESAAAIVKALQALGINDQVSDADKLLALEIKQAINSGSFSEELISKLNEAAPSRAIFQNQVYSLKAFGKTTKDTIMKHFDVMALNFLKTGNSLQAFWARVPDIVVVDSIKNQTTARGSFVTQGTGGRVAEDQGRVPTGELVTDVAISTDETPVNIPFSPVPNRIVLVRGKYNASTPFHENDHNMIVTGMAQQVVEAQEGGVELWDEVLTEVGATRGQPWSVAAHEKWARAREAWINGGEVKSVFTRVFNALKTIFTNIYTSGALTKHRSPVLEKAFVKIYDIGSDQQYETGAKQSENPTEEEKNQVQRDDRTAFEPSREGVAYPFAKMGSRAIISAKTQDIIARLSEFTGYEAKLNWLNENGFLTLIDGKTHINYDDRIMVLMRLGDLNLPFYISTGQAGKQNVPKNKWYFVFGIGKDGWINKGTEEQIANQYGWPILQKMASILDNGVGFIDYLQVPEFSGSAETAINSRTNFGISPASLNDGWEGFVAGANIALVAIGDRVRDIGNSLLAEKKAKDALREDIKAKVARETGYEASKLLAHIPATKLEHAQRIIETVKLNPDLGAAKAELVVLATTVEGDSPAFTDDEVFSMLGIIEQLYTGKQAPLGLPLYDEVDNHFAAVKGSNTYYGAVRQKGKPKDITQTYGLDRPKLGLNTVIQSDPIEVQDSEKQSESGQKYEISIVASKPEMSSEMKQAVIQKIRGLSPDQSVIEAFFESSTQEPVVLTDPETGTTVVDSAESVIIDENGSQVSVRANETIASQANKILSNASKAAYASFIGAVNWTSEAASRFAKDFADFVMGAKFPSAISEIFSRFMVSLKPTMLTGLSFFSLTNFVGQEIVVSKAEEVTVQEVEIKKFTAINPPKTKDGSYIEALIDIRSAPQPPKYEGESISVHDEVKNDAATVLDYVTSTGDNNGKPFIIVSKREGSIRAYDKNGKLVHKSTVLLGKSYGDVVANRKRDLDQIRDNDKLKITPSGRWETETDTSSEYGRVVPLQEYEGGTRNAIHTVCTKFAHERRLDRLAGKLPNRISYGCINVYAATATIANDLMEDGGVVYVTPDEQTIEGYVEGMRDSALQNQAGLFQDSVTETVVTPEQDQQYLDLAADPVANQEALQRMTNEAAMRSGKVKYLDRYVDASYLQAVSKRRKAWSNAAQKLFGIRMQPSEIPVVGNRYLRINDFPEIIRDLVTVSEVSKKLNRETDMAGNEILDILTTPYEEGVEDPVTGINSATFDLEMGFRNSLRSKNIQRKEAIDRIKEFTKGLYSDSEIIGISSNLPSLDSIESEDRTNVYNNKKPAPYVSADPVTYDANGNIIPLSQRFNQQPNNTLYQDSGTETVVTPEQDRKYLALASDPVANREALQNMVNDAAKNANPLIEQWENYDYRFRQLRRLYNAPEVGDPESGYVTQQERDLWRKDAERYAQENSLEIQSIEDISDRDLASEIATRAEGDIDSMLYRMAKDSGFGEDVSAFYNAAESAYYDYLDLPAITKDSQGNVIPLSKRFSQQSNNTLYQDSSMESMATKEQVDRFNKLTDSLYQGRNSATQEEIDAWKKANPEAWSELSQMREDALIKAGYSTKASHRTNETFTEFLRGYENKKSRAIWAERTGSDNVYAGGIYFYPENEFGDSRSKNFYEGAKVLNVFLNTGRVYEAGQFGGELSTISEERINELKNLGFDSAVTPESAILDAGQIVVFDPEQIKSADPISAGQKVTPDQWADRRNPNILFQDSGMEATAPMDIIQQAIAPRTTNRLYQFAGETAQRSQFLTDSLDAAKAMAAAGKTQEEIRAITGWFPSPYDGKMRWEIPDDKVEWIGPDSFAEMMVESNERKKPDKTSYYRFRLKDVLSHKELFDAYPEAERIAFDIDENLKPLGQLKGNALKLWPTYDLSLSPKTKMKIILHEIQHWIQNKEGFAVGGSSDIIGRSNYYKLAGEIEARDVEARANLTPEQRAAIAPYSSENIAPKEAIVLFQDSGIESIKAVKRKRDPEITKAAADLKQGKIDRDEYQRIVDLRMPLRKFENVPVPASNEDMIRGLGNRTISRKDSDGNEVTIKKTEFIQSPESITSGKIAESRLDIPAYETQDVWVVSLHEPRANLKKGNAGPVFAYTPTSVLRNVEFGVTGIAAINIAAGKEKSTIATMKGEYVPMTADQAYEMANSNKDKWVEIGMNPIRHSYFYDKDTQTPVESAEMVVQVGGMVLAKNPVFGDRANYLYQAQETSGYSDSAIRGIIGMGHSMLQMAGRLNLKIDNNKIQKQINTLVNSQNNRSGRPVKAGTVQKAASALFKSYQEFYGNLEEDSQGLLVQLAYEKSFAIEDFGLDADSLARRNNVRRRKGQPIEEQQRIAIQDKVKTLYNTFRNARNSNFFKNRMKDQISPEFGKVADRILKLVNRGLDNVMGAFNSTNEDLLLRFADNIDAYNKKAYEGTPEFIEQFNQTVGEVEEAVMEHLTRQFYAYNSAYTDAEGITPEIDALIAQLPRIPEESAMDHYERTVNIIRQIEAAMFSIAAEGDPNGQSAKDKKAAQVRAKREKMAHTHQAALLEKFPTADDMIAYQREKDGGVLTPEFEKILRDNYTDLTEAQIEDLSDTDLRVFNSTALTMIVGGSNTQFLTLPKRQWREAKVASWHALVESMTNRVGQSPLVRSIYRSASRSNFLERQLNNFDRVFQANVENFHVWIDRLSQYAPVRDWFDRQFFADFQASVFVQAENARKAAEGWSQDTINQYNDEVDTTVDANPYLWVMSMLSQYNLGSDPNKEFSKAVTRARTSIQRTIDQKRSARLVSEANRNLVALNYMLEGINVEADNSYDLFMNNATIGNRIGAGNAEKAAKRLELLSNITNYFQQDIANQKFIRENIFGKPFQTVVNYLPLKALKVDGTLDEWDWASIEPNAEYQVAAQNVNARSNEERVDDLGQDRAYAMDFFNMVERKAVKNALDKHAILPVAILSDIFKTESKTIDGVEYRVPKDNAIKTIFGSQPEVVNQLSIIKEKITHQMVQIYGVTEPATGFVGGLKKALSIVQGSMLSGVGQIAQQSTAAVVDYAAREEGNIGYMIDAMIYWSKNYNKYRDWLFVNNKDLYERGNTQGIREFERHVNNAGSELNSLIDKGWQGMDQIRKFMTISLRYGDKIGAELIFLAEHMKAVKQSGQMPVNGDYDIDSYSNPSYTARAQAQLAKFVGPSSAAGRSYWMSDHKQHYFLLRSLTGSFQSSAHNMSSQMISAARNIVALQSDKSPEGKAERIAEYRKIGSIMAQQATFTGMRYIVGAMITYAFVGAIKDAWDDEDGAIEEAQLALEAAKNKFYPSKADKEMAVTMAERRLADAKSIRRAVVYMKQQASGDALFKSMVRDQLQNLHIAGSVGDGFVPKIFMMVPNSMAEQSHQEAQDLVISKLKKEKSEALAMGDRRKAAKIGESILNAQAVEYIPYFYDKKDKSGFGGIVGGMLDPIFTSVKEGVEDMTRADKDFLTARAFVPDTITYMAALGLGQADVNRIARQLQRIDDDLSKNRDEANERAGKEVDKLTNKSKTPFLR